MKKNDQYNEVPLKQFLEFFMKSAVSMQIDYFEYFLIACKNICIIDVVDNPESRDKNEKVTTIKLKNGVLKDLIVDSKNDPILQTLS